MKKFILFCLLGTLACILFGCSRAPKTTETGVNISSEGGTGEVQEIKLKDGTRCAVLMGYRKGALSCDWHGPASAFDMRHGDAVEKSNE